ncbi:hypothetical protein ACFLT5_03095 [Chloroflexota bacterium]
MRGIRTRLVAERCRPMWKVAVLLILGVGLSTMVRSASAQEGGSVQESTARIEPGEIVLYRLPGLVRGQRLYVYAEATSGNLDPLVGIADTGLDPQKLESEYEAALDRAIARGEDPLEVVERMRDETLLAWDDDGGGGLTAALEFEVPADGDYRLLVGGALTVLGGQTFGDYRLLAGLDAPQVLEGDAEPTGEVIAVPDPATLPGVGVQEFAGTLTPEKASTFLHLNRFKEDDALYVYLEATSGDLIPTVELQNFARKPVRSGNSGGLETVASLQYTFPSEDGQNYWLEIASWGEGDKTTAGDYRLLVGVNAPEVLTGVADAEGGRDVVLEPIEVRVGATLEQIVDVNQQSEFFTAVGSLQMEWIDPALAFNPEACGCDAKSFSGPGVDQMISGTDSRWPDFALQNQQGNRWIQNQTLTIAPNGHATYFERFTTDFQVDFDFRRYPFDGQELVIRVDSLQPEELYRYATLEGFGDVSAEHGEDELILSDFETSVSSEVRRNGDITSRFTFSVEAQRLVSYYVLRVFVPILLIILVSWITFFLKDYGRRIEVATGNLLLFIAFSWSLADNYPRLGYLTFLDAVMVIMFVVNALVVVYNVWLRRMEMRGQEAQADRIDSVLDWSYPLAYIVSFGLVIVWFF